jgi:hypothetical protein
MDSNSLELINPSGKPVQHIPLIILLKDQNSSNCTNFLFLIRLIAPEIKYSDYNFQSQNKLAISRRYLCHNTWLEFYLCPQFVKFDKY